MAFVMDRQTFADLEIFEGGKSKKSVFKLFNATVSRGGKQELLDMFRNPLSDLKSIQERQELIHYINKERSTFTIDKYLLDFIESYLLIGNKPNKVSRFNAWHKSLKYQIQPTNERYIIQRSIVYIIDFLQELYAYATENAEENRPKYFQLIEETIRDTELNQVLGFNTKKKIKAIDIERFDYIFRYGQYDRLKDMLQVVYQIDAFQAVGIAISKYNFVFPEISDQQEIQINGLYHPFLEEPIANDIQLNADGNLFFVTGANMAGKSTFLKAFGIAVYLAHLGFPIPAVSMRLGVFNGLFSTINIADNLNKGYSHFYSEVFRIKEIAQEMNKSRNLVVIFDELFRGTNVKDAYDASLAIISAFAKVKNSMFLVSTHMMEIAEKLRCIDNIRFGYFHTTIDHKTPTYSYCLKEGVTEERLGMLILENEKIIEIIEAGI